MGDEKNAERVALPNRPADDGDTPFVVEAPR